MQAFDIGHDLTAVTLGMDVFARRNAEARRHLAGEGLLPIYLGEGRVAPRAYDGADGVAADLDVLRTRVEALAGGPRRTFLLDMLRSLGVAARMMGGEEPSFAEKVESLVGAPAGRVDPALVEGARDGLDALLGAAGHGAGPLRERLRAWEEAEAVPAERVPAAFRELMAEAKARTDARVFDTGAYDMALNPVRGTMFTARCNFAAGQMDLNMDLAFTRAALKHLICHEVYPGHSTQLLSTRAAAEAGRAPADALLIAADAVTGNVQEGIGDQGIELIDFVEDDGDRIHREAKRLRSMAQSDAAWMLMAEGRPAGEVRTYLRDVGLGQDAWIDGRMRFAAHPFRGPFLASYWAGNECVRRVRERVAAEQRPAFLAALYEHAQSPDSLALFPATAAGEPAP